MKDSQTSKEQKFHHSVYVVLLDNAVAKHPPILRANPRRDPLKPCVYVGMTGLPVDHRFENHKDCYKSAWVVKKYGVRLMPELYEHLNPMPFEAAAEMEIELAEDLRAEGYTVTGGRYRGFDSRPPPLFIGKTQKMSRKNGLVRTRIRTSPPISTFVCYCVPMSRN
jgi:hypothetical protein